MASSETKLDLFRRYDVLDPLRGIASLWVFLFHYSFTSEFLRQTGYFQDVLRIGKLGVAMFFAISGFCLTLAARRAIEQKHSPLTFLGRRAWRIYPTFWMSIVFILALRACMTAVVPSTIAPTKLPAVPDYTWWDWLKVISLGQQFDPRFGVWFARFNQVNSAYWSLAIEFQFYAIVTIAMYVPRYFYHILGALAVIATPFAVLNGLFFQSVATGACLAYWPWFACGVGAFWLLERDYTPQRFFGRQAENAARLYGGLVTAILVALAIGKVRIFYDFGVAAATAGGIWLSAGVSARAFESENDGRRLWSACIVNPLTLLGAMSYSLYLMHNELYLSLRRLLLWQGVRLDGAADLLVIVGTLLGAYWFYRCGELPFLRTANTATPLQRASAAVDEDVLSDVGESAKPAFKLASLQLHLTQ